MPTNPTTAASPLFTVTTRFRSLEQGPPLGRPAP